MSRPMSLSIVEEPRRTTDQHLNEGRFDRVLKASILRHYEESGVTYYEIQLRQLETIDEQTGEQCWREWQVARRYNEFDILREKLESAHNIKVENFPGKALFTTDGVLSERKIELTAFMNEVALPLWSVDKDVTRFIELCWCGRAAGEAPHGKSDHERHSERLKKELEKTQRQLTQAEQERGSAQHQLIEIGWDAQKNTDMLRAAGMRSLRVVLASLVSGELGRLTATWRGNMLADWAHRVERVGGERAGPAGLTPVNASEVSSQLSELAGALEEEQLARGRAEEKLRRAERAERELRRELREERAAAVATAHLRVAKGEIPEPFYSSPCPEVRQAQMLHEMQLAGASVALTGESPMGQLEGELFGSRAWIKEAKKRIKELITGWSADKKENEALRHKYAQACEQLDRLRHHASPASGTRSVASPAQLQLQGSVGSVGSDATLAATGPFSRTDRFGQEYHRYSVSPVSNPNSPPPGYRASSVRL